VNALGYSIVLATRNRLDALRVSVPRMLAQSPPPAQLIVVDSSDDHVPVQSAVREACRAHPARLTIHQAERGLTRQRNIGLREVDQPVVFFPDDDSIFFPGMAAAVLDVYSRDAGNNIAGVCAYESLVPPPDFATARIGYQMSKGDRLKQPLLRFRNRIETRLFPDPGHVLGRSLMSAAGLPPWLKEAGTNPVEWMTGFRMTFRTSVIRAIGFDETLKRYCLFEDRDASFGAWRIGAVVATSSARVFHYRSPEKRDAGYRMGVEQLLNQAYIIIKHTPVGHPARRCLLRFARYKIILYRLAAGSRFGSERLLGATTALKMLPELLNTPSEKSRTVYLDALDRCLLKS